MQSCGMATAFQEQVPEAKGKGPEEIEESWPEKGT